MIVTAFSLVGGTQRDIDKVFDRKTDGQKDRQKDRKMNRLTE